MEIKPTHAIVNGVRICSQLEIGETVVYPLPFGRSVETDFLAALETHISVVKANHDSYKKNVQNKRDAAERLQVLLVAKRFMENMGDYNNVNGEICPAVRS